ncbi:MAG: hypothetical protein RR744_00300 [Cellulosilyticaceae bacterium]
MKDGTIMICTEDIGVFCKGDKIILRDKGSCFSRLEERHESIPYSVAGGKYWNPYNSNYWQVYMGDPEFEF